MTSQLADSESSFRAEISTSQRLIQLLQQREVETRVRLDEVEREWESAQSSLQETKFSYDADIMKERVRADALDSRLQEMRSFADQLAANGAPSYADEDVFGTPIARSPVIASLPFKLKKAGGKSYTEIYTSYIRMQEELEMERAESQRLSQALTDILSEIQERSPYLKEQRIEYERTMAENNEISVALANALEDKDESARLAEDWHRQADQKSREAVVVAQQLDDASRQLRSLIHQIAILEDPNIVDRADTEEATELQNDNTETAAAYISSQLLTFTSIDQLQIQNQNLLKIVRELGAKMEAEEAGLTERMGRAENEAVEEAHELILRLKEEVEVQRTQMGAYHREREMLRQVLKNRGNLRISEDGELSDSTPRDDASAARAALEDVQKNFEAYKNEIGLDNKALRDDLASTRREASQIQIELARANAKREMLEERMKMLADTNKRQSKEAVDLSRRNTELQSAMGRQDDATRRVTEEVLTTKSSYDRARHEAMMLKAEKEVWKVSLVSFLSIDPRSVLTNDEFGRMWRLD